MSAASYRYHRAIAEAFARNVSVSPQRPEQVRRLSSYLVTTTRRQYEGSLQRLAAKYGVTLNGRLTDAQVLARLQQRADFAAQSIATTLQKEFDRAQTHGQAAQDVLQGRANWKSDQVWTTELTTADQMAWRDFYDNHSELAAQATAHVEPTDAQEPDCQALIDEGSIPVSQIAAQFPLHVGCDHGYETDDPSPDSTLVVAGTSADMPRDDAGLPHYDHPLLTRPAGGNGLAAALPLIVAGMTSRDVQAHETTADLLNAIGWWAAGMAIVAALGDHNEDGGT